MADLQNIFCCEDRTATVMERAVCQVRTATVTWKEPHTTSLFPAICELTATICEL